MTDSEGEGGLSSLGGRRGVEQRLLRIIDEAGDNGIPFDDLCRAMSITDAHGHDADQLARFVRSLPTVELLTHPATLQRTVRKTVWQRQGLSSHPGGDPRRKKGTTKRPALGVEALDDLEREQGRVGYLCIADEFDLSEIKRYYERLGLHVRQVVDVLHVCPKASVTGGGGKSDYGATSSHPATGGGLSLSSSSTHFDLFVFDYGVAVWWGSNPRMFNIVESDFVLPSSKLNKYFVNRFKTSLIQQNFPVWCTYSSDTREQFGGTLTNEPDQLFAERLKYDHFLIRDNSAEVKLCVSHALAQSAKIDYLEIKVAQLTQQCKPLPRQLKDRGSVTITERSLLQLQGEVLYFRLMLKSGSDLLDEPELFWHNPWLKPFYDVTKSSFQIQNRVETLDAKLDAANEILSLISDQFKHSHGSRLEWIVIWLVMVEVIIGVLELLVDIKPWLVGDAAGRNGGAPNGPAQIAQAEGALPNGAEHRANHELFASGAKLLVAP